MTYSYIVGPQCGCLQCENKRIQRPLIYILWRVRNALEAARTVDKMSSIPNVPLQASRVANTTASGILQ